MTKLEDAVKNKRIERCRRLLELYESGLKLKNIAEMECVSIARVGELIRKGRWDRWYKDSVIFPLRYKERRNAKV